jgi:hypothetical protein
MDIDLTGTLTLGELIVGVGTLVLAAFTYWLGWSTRNEGAKVAEQVGIERERLESESRPYVVLAPDRAWSHGSGEGRYEADLWATFLPIKNVGPGAALNIQGSLDFGPPSGAKARLVPTSIGPGEYQDMRVHARDPARLDWKHVAGILDYEDSNQAAWRTRFSIDTEGDYRYVNVLEVALIRAADGIDVPS